MSRDRSIDASGRKWFHFISFTVPGKPVPWARHKGMGTGSSTPPRQKAFKNNLAGYAWEQMLSSFRPRSRDPRDAIAFRQEIRIFAPLPAAMRKQYDRGSGTTWRADEIREERLYCIDRPDLDNWIKLPMDALNGIVWKDDGQVVSFDGSGKFYSLRPRLEFVAYTLEDLRK